MAGIGPVDRGSRVLDAWGLLAIWFGAGISIAEFWAGALLVPGVSLFTGLLVIIVGHLIGNFLMGLVALEGYETGLPTMVLTRRPLGLAGSYLASVLNYIQLVGWTAVMNIVGARAMDTVASSLGLQIGYSTWIILIGLLNTLWALIGPASWRILEKASAALLLVLVAWLTIVVLNTTGPIDWLAGDTGRVTVGQALDLVVAMPVSWLPLVADYSRLALSGAFKATFLGYFASSSLFYFIGGLTNLYRGMSDPIAIIVSYGLGIPAMTIIVLSTTTTTFLDIYSAAVSFKNIRPGEPLWRQVLIVGVVGTILALLFPVEEYEWFLLLIGGVFVPLAAIMITDYFILCRRSYRLDEVIGASTPLVRLSGVASWITGFAIYMAISLLLPWLGATLPAMLATSIIYLVASRIAGSR